MTSQFGKMVFITPSYNPVGGVVKIFDYLNHAVRLGFEPTVCCPEPFEPELPLFQNERFAGLTPEKGVRFVHGLRFGLDDNDFAFFSWPTHYIDIAPRLRPGLVHEQVIHIVQNVRHANPSFADGYGLRLLSRPMARIMTNDVVENACRAYLNRESFTQVIDLGVDTSSFATVREGGLNRPVRVGYTTWKSLLGGEVERELSNDRRFLFRSIRGHVSWSDLAELYRWCDVFLCTPDPEEGFYMPGFEAMSAGAIVVTPDAGGNRVYCRFGENCLYVDYDDVDDYVSALQDLAEMPVENLEELRRSAYQTVESFSLEREFEHFRDFMDRLSSRVSDKVRISREPTGLRVLRTILEQSEKGAQPARLPDIHELMPEEPAGRFPDFLGIGAQKAGTTWLHQSFDLHPDIWVPKEKELHYFDEKFGRRPLELRERAFGRHGEATRWRRQLKRQLSSYERRHPTEPELAWDLTYFLGEPSDEWYSRLFRPSRDDQVAGEFTPEYCSLSPTVIEHIRELMPELKIIFFMRNPIERAWSHASMFRRLADTDDVRHEQLVRHLRGRRSEELTDYASMIDRWTTAFPPRQFFVGFLEDISFEPELVLASLSSFLGLTGATSTERGKVIRRKVHSGGIETIPSRYAVILAERYMPLMETLSDRFGGYATGWLHCGRAILDMASTDVEIPYPLWEWPVWQEWAEERHNHLGVEPRQDGAIQSKRLDEFHTTDVDRAGSLQPEFEERRP